MTDAAGTIAINQVEAVFVPVADQQRAPEFYLDELGFEKRVDFFYGEDIRWIKVASPGAANTSTANRFLIVQSGCPPAAQTSDSPSTR